MDRLLDGLNDAQREAVTTDAAPLVIVAGAGSGKTRVLTSRIAHRCLTGTAEARHVLALTFTRKAAGELSTRVRAHGLRDNVTAGTFHAVAFAQLRQWWSDRGWAAPDLLERKVPTLMRLLGRSATTRAVDAAGEIEWAKARLVAPEDYPAAARAAGREVSLGHDAMATLYRRYEDEKKSRRQVDFDDLLRLCARAIEQDETFAAAQRWRFRHLFVDEFQDVNPLQFELLRAWRGDRPDLCVVGDPNQAIYAWNGADPTLLQHVDRHIPGATTVVLDRNYRSTPQVLATANRILDAGGVPGLRLKASRGDGPAPTVRRFDTDRAEARAIARSLLDHHAPGVPWSHQAVLVRTNAQTVLLAEACRAVRIPVRVRGQLPFLDLPEIKEALRAIQRSRQGLRHELAALEERVDAAEQPGVELAETERSRIANLEELLRLAGEYAGDDPSPNAAGFLAWLAATLGRDDSAGDVDAVDLATFHAAKGLEWPVVHLAGLEDGLVPIGHAKTSEAVAEERRLFYVAITRAERELHLSWAAERVFGTRTAKRRPSPYLDDLEPLFAALRSGMSVEDAARSVAVARAALEQARTARPASGATKNGGKKPAPAPGDEALFEALRKWRSGRARAANVPAYVVFDDKTLVALAARRPRTSRELLGVPGIGPTKADRFGDEVLELVAAHAAAGTAR